MNEKVKPFQISKSQYQVISQYFFEKDWFKKIKKNENNYIIFVNNEEQKDIIDVMTELLTSIGLDSQDEPNAFGIEIEKIIDIFNPY